MSLVFEHFDKAVREQAKDELRAMMPEVLTTEEYDEAINTGMVGLGVIISESIDLARFTAAIEAMDGIGSQETAIINMHMDFVKSRLKMSNDGKISIEGLDEFEARNLALENGHAVIIAAVAAAVALIIAFWDHIFSALFTPSNITAKMEQTSKAIKKDPKALNVKKYANATLKDKSDELKKAYSEGKFLPPHLFMAKYSPNNAAGDEKIDDVLKALNNYEKLISSNGYVEKVLDALYKVGEFYISDDYYSLLEKLSITIKNKAVPNNSTPEKASRGKKVKGTTTLDLSDVSDELKNLARKYNDEESKAVENLVALFTNSKAKEGGLIEYACDYNARSIFLNTYIYVKKSPLNLKTDKVDDAGNMHYIELNADTPSSYEVPNKGFRLELPDPDQRGKVSETFDKIFEGTTELKGGKRVFVSPILNKHTAFNESNFTKTLNDRKATLDKLVKVIDQVQSNHIGAALKRLVNASKTNLNVVLKLCGEITLTVYKKDTMSAYFLIKEIRLHDRDTKPV